MKHAHWYYFIALVDELEETSRYVEFSPENFATYSTEFSKLILAACSEIDVVCKLLCQKIKPDSQAANIREYQKAILPTYKHLPSIEVVLRRYEISLRPWESWSTDHTPDWWNDHNDIKHHRDQHYRKSSLKNAIASVAGLAVMVTYLYHDELSQTLTNTIPSFLFVAYQYNRGSVMLAKPLMHLPDFPKTDPFSRRKR
ncbi:MAG: hypothetical protein AB7T27_08725 [Kiritimatiellia bacterium]